MTGAPPFLASVIAVALLLVVLAAGVVHVVRTRRATEAGLDALETAARSSMGQLRAMSFTELTELNRRLAGLSASGVIAVAMSIAHARHRVATALHTKTPGC